MKSLLARASRYNAVPGLHFFTNETSVTGDEVDGFLNSQRLAVESAKVVASHIQPGWTEIQAAKMLNTYLQDMGVHSFFHSNLGAEGF